MGLCAKLMTLAPKARAALLSAGADASSGFDVTTIMADSVKKVSSNKRGQWHRMPCLFFVRKFISCAFLPRCFRYRDWFCRTR